MARRRKAAGPTPAAARPPAWLLLPVLLVATLAAYQPAVRGGLVWDDDAHITKPELRSIDGLRRIWGEVGATQQYYPVLHSAFWLEHRLWGDDTAGYHLTNIILHSVSAFLLLVFLRRLRVPGAEVAGVVFALHPLNVESVAWISEQKNVLSGVLCFGAAVAYLRFDEERRTSRYAVALGLFALALGAKTTAAVLPAILLAAAWWKTGRVTFRRDVVPVLPFLVLSLSAAVMTAWVERTYIGAAGSEFDLSIVDRILVAGRAPWFYAAKFVWPFPLIFNYPRWHLDPRDWVQWIYPAALAVGLWGCWALRRRSRAPLAIAVTYLAALSPALGFVDVFPFRYAFVADHFAYLAIAPLSVAAAAACAMASRRIESMVPRIAAAIALAALLVFATRGYARDYQGAETLYRATIARNPGSWLAQNNLGRLLLDKGQSSEAREHLQNAIALQPGRAEPYANLGRLCLRYGPVAEAIGFLQRAVEIEPSNPAVQFNLGMAMAAAGRVSEALPPLSAAAALRPDAAEVRFQLANVLQRLGRYDEAVTHYRAALVRAPREAAILNNLGGALLSAGRLDEAERAFSDALAAQPDFPEAANNLRRLRAMR